MTDPFALLGLQRRPLLSEEEVGIAYRRLAGELHPDQVGGDAVRFKELGEAAAILRDHSRRLRCMIDRSAGTDIPTEAADLFPRVASLTHEADDLLGRHATATNPLAKAVLAAPLKKLSIELDLLIDAVREWQSSLNAKLAVLDAAWPTHDPKEVASLADAFSYVTRWESQLRERKLVLESL